MLRDYTWATRHRHCIWKHKILIRWNSVSITHKGHTKHKFFPLFEKKKQQKMFTLNFSIRALIEILFFFLLSFASNSHKYHFPIFLLYDFGKAENFLVPFNKRKFINYNRFEQVVYIQTVWNFAKQRRAACCNGGGGGGAMYNSWIWWSVSIRLRLRYVI